MKLLVVEVPRELRAYKWMTPMGCLLHPSVPKCRHPLHYDFSNKHVHVCEPFHDRFTCLVPGLWLRDWGLTATFHSLLRTRTAKSRPQRVYFRNCRRWVRFRACYAFLIWIFGWCNCTLSWYELPSIWSRLSSPDFLVFLACCERVLSTLWTVASTTDFLGWARSWSHWRWGWCLRI